MKKIYVKINGMTCDHCKSKINTTLMRINNVKKINFDGHIAEIEYNGNINKQKIIDSILEIDYYTDLNLISDNKKHLKKNISISEILIFSCIIILISLILNRIFGFNIFNMIPVINSNTTYMMFFITGIFTSIHCVSMCGAINLLATTSSTRNLKKPLFYNLGRLISYTLLGGIVGLLGSVLRINVYVQGFIIILASIFMILMSLNMMGIINFSFNFKRINLFNNVKAKGSFMIGLLNGFMPCGPLQAMQLYALSTGSFIHGALSMFLFCLGTIPLLLLMGVIPQLLNNNQRKYLNKFLTVLILLLSLTMFNRGLLSMGINVFDVFKPNYDNYLKSEIKEYYQVVEFDLSYGGYKDIIVQKGIPVKMIINAKPNVLTGCNNAIRIKSFNISQELKIGKNVIEFTPNKTGRFTYTCWMNMLKNNIVVIDDSSFFIKDEGGNINE